MKKQILAIALLTASSVHANDLVGLGRTIGVTSICGAIMKGVDIEKALAFKRKNDLFLSAIEKKGVSDYQLKQLTDGAEEMDKIMTKATYEQRLKRCNYYYDNKM